MNPDDTDQNINRNSNSAFKTVFNDVARSGMNTGIKFGCLLLFILFLIPVLCFTSIFAFRYFTRETKQSLSDSLPWNSQDVQKQNEKKFEEPEKKNKSVIIGKVEWKVLDAKVVTDKLPGDDGETDYCKPGDGNKFIYVKYSIRNVDRAFVTVPKNFNDIFDKNENKYAPSSKSAKCLTGESTLSEKYLPEILQRDEKVEFEVLYEVPKDAKDFRLKVGDLSTVGKDFDYIALGV